MRPTAAWTFCLLIASVMSLGVRPRLCHAIGIEPDLHAVVGRRQHRDIADSRHALEAVDDVDGRVVGEKQLVVSPVRRRHRHDLQQRRRLLGHADALAAHLHGQLRFSQSDPVLGLDGVEIGIGADREGHGERIAAVVAAGRLHVEHAVDADDARLQSAAPRWLRHLGAGARIVAGDRDLRRHDVGELRDRDLRHRDRAGERDDDETTTANRGRAMKIPDSIPYPTGLISVGWTTCPGRTRWMPSAMVSFAFAQPLGDDDACAAAFADLDAAHLDLVVLVDDQDEDATGLVGLQGLLRDQQRLVALADLGDHVDQRAVDQRSIGIRNTARA